MAQLRITTAAALGPLSVEVLGTRGERVGNQLTMSSTSQHAVIDAISPGNYTVVATRPSGERLVSSAKVGPLGGDATISSSGSSPVGLLTDADRFGLAYTRASAWTDDFRLAALQSPRAASSAARSMSVLLGKSDPATGIRFSLTDVEGDVKGVHRSADYKLACWQYSKGYWRNAKSPSPSIAGDYVQVGATGTQPTAIGILNDGGFGPIVIVPPLSEGIDVTFLAAGVAMEENADRATNPSAVRVPVALSVPRNSGLSDLLVGVNAAALPNATEILQQGRGGDALSALDFVSRKFEDSAAAVLGGLFLARFAPSKLPLAWLRNLNSILPDVADTWVLLAWVRSTQGDGDWRWEMSITEQLRHATGCRCTMFNRSRYQLNQLSRRYGPYSRARQDEVTTPRRPRVGDFLDFSADAGGLEAFWGYSPTRPDRSFPSKPIKPSGLLLKMRNGKFIS
jgi:hypothetical protein